MHSFVRIIPVLLGLACFHLSHGETAPDDEIIQQEQRFYKALKEQDLDYLGSILHADFIFSGIDNPTGHMDREEYLATRSKQDIAKKRIKHLKTTRIDDLAMAKIIVSMEKTYDDKNASGDYAVTAIWLKENGKWKLLTRHISKLK